ncbi:electron transport complex subunit RsxC [Parendozoicomonas sp. Alg238-R29]|uniref:electron transport complex subunit RsxC n=1 Tax=Parendozoicomonas sp. Alg238-R29 TaxID=2993446 RepID=UPI00248EB517|nr:electron transport complex subunit RsxC [Parendozoicomonas sp. Alg238-R29]
MKKSQKGFLQMLGAKGGFRHGIHPEENKEQTEHKAIRRIPFPKEMVLPLAQHRGAPAKPVVVKGQDVVRGELVAEAGGYVSAPIHAPVTGTVAAVDKLVSMPDGTKGTAIIIRTWPSSSQEVLYRKTVDTDVMSPDELVQAVQSAGVVGLGGAAFPTHVKMKAPQGKTITTLVGNGCECEPFLTCDHRIMLEYAENMIRGARLAMKTTGATRTIIGVEDNKMDAVQRIREAIAAFPGDNSDITCEAVKTQYPQGAEKMLIKSLLDLEVPCGGIPADIGCAVFNVGTLAQIGELVPESRGLIERIVTVSGSGVNKPGNYLVPLGTPLPELLKHAEAMDDPGMVILGGPMMGGAIATTDIACTKGITGVLVFPPESLPSPDESEEMPCIGCRACVEACPMLLNPSTLGRLAQNDRYEDMADKFHMWDCFECGCCANVCPSNIPLTQLIRVAKGAHRQRNQPA